MDKLKGSGSTFSTSGKRWMPFHYDPVHTRKQAKLRRLQAQGLTLPTDKASLRQAAEQASASTPITRIPKGRRTRLKGEVD